MVFTFEPVPVVSREIGERKHSIAVCIAAIPGAFVFTTVSVDDDS